MLTRHITKRMTIPHEPDHWMELRRLSWTDLQHASDVHATVPASVIVPGASPLASASNSSVYERPS